MTSDARAEAERRYAVTEFTRDKRVPLIEQDAFVAGAVWQAERMRQAEQLYDDLYGGEARSSSGSED